MPPASANTFLDSVSILLFIRGAILIILIFYAIFALLIVRQAELMSKTLITPVSPLVKAISIIHAGFAVAFIVLTFGIL